MNPPAGFGPGGGATVKRSENVGLVLMGATAFAATFAAGMAYFAWQKPSQAAQAQAVTAESCAARSDNQNCQPERRGYASYLYPRFSGCSWGWSSGSEPRTREVALTNGRSLSASPGASSNTLRSGFGSTARSTSIRISAGG
jgi:hypothetical protein